MPNLNDTKTILESFVSNNVTGIPFAYDNIEYTGDKNFYASIRVQFVYDSNINIGSILHKRIRHEGDIVFKLYSEIGIGTKKSLTALDNIKTQVENKYISENLMTYAAEPTREGADESGNYINFLRIPFVSDE